MAIEQGKRIMVPWDDPREQIDQGPEDLSPKRLASFYDFWVFKYMYVGNHHPGAVFRCKSNVTEWGTQWKKDNDGKVRILPNLVHEGRVHPTSGLDILEMQGLDETTVLLIVEEKMPKSESMRVYGLILDYSSMKLALCKTCTEMGFLFCKDNIPKWTPRKLEIQWDLIEEARMDANSLKATGTFTTVNQNAAGEQKEQSFTKQLLKARIKWRKMGSPQPNYQGRQHSAAYQEFNLIMSTIFTSEATKLKIPLIFLEDDTDVNRWIKIEEDYLKGLLPDSLEVTTKSRKTNRKPLTIYDFKTLYGLRADDIRYLASLVESKQVCLKSSKARSKNMSRQLISLPEAGSRERLIRAMKNEMMCHFKEHLLPSKKLEYKPYTTVEWEEFEFEKKVGRLELELWVDKAMATVAGKQWLEDRTKPLNKTYDPKDCPPTVIELWKSFINAKVEVTMVEAMEKGFAEKYLSKTMDENSWNITKILAQPDVIAWRGKKKRHIYFWYMFEATKNGPRAKILEDRKLRRVFDALEYTDQSWNIIQARSPAILVTNAKGFYDIVCHLDIRKREVKTRVWDWHVVNYIATPNGGFPMPATGVGFNVFLFFCFGYNEEQNARSRFTNFFPSKNALEPVYKALEMGEDVHSYWRRRGVPYLRVNTALKIFANYIIDDMVVVNVNGGPEITHLGMWAKVKVLEIFHSIEAATTGGEVAKQIVDHVNINVQSKTQVDIEDLLADTLETEENPKHQYFERSNETEHPPTILEVTALPPAKKPRLLKNPTKSDQL